MELVKDLTCYFGLGKSLRNRETSTIPAGTKVTSRFDRDGVHKFTIIEFGKMATYAVDNAKILDAYLQPASS